MSFFILAVYRYIYIHTYTYTHTQIHIYVYKYIYIYINNFIIDIYFRVSAKKLL